jgi:hypothetical protein
MIDIKELKPDNYITLDYHNQGLITFHKIIEIKDSHILVTGIARMKNLVDGEPEVFDDISKNSAPVFIEEVRGIELSDEILAKCGFIKFKKIGLTEHFLANTELGIIHDDYIYLKYGGEIEGGVWIPEEIKYLHQLQNFYKETANLNLNIEL